MAIVEVYFVFNSRRVLLLMLPAKINAKLPSPAKGPGALVV